MRSGRHDELDEYRGPPEEIVGRLPPRLLPHFVFVTMLAACSLVAVHYFAGASMFERTLQALATPVGVAWLALLLGSYWVTVWRIRLASLLCWTSWLVLTLAGNSFVSNRLISMLEAPYARIDPFQLDRFDAVLVLGGGTDVSPAKVPQLAFAGDRLALAARMYHAGKIERILVMDLASRGNGEGESHPEGISASILADLNVPKDVIVELPTRADTSEEIQALKAWSADQSFKRVGIITSAWHLKRALILARRYGVAAAPVPAGFLGKSFEPGPGVIIPSAYSLFVTQLATKEFAGRWLDK